LQLGWRKATRARAQRQTGKEYFIITGFSDGKVGEKKMPTKNGFIFCVLIG